MNYIKVPLETRLKRAEMGYSASPQLSRKIIDDFCNTPIIPALESFRAFTERRRLCELMKNPYLKEAYKCNDNPTFYDIAAIITRHYLKYGITPPDTVDTLTCKIEELIVIYFNCIDTIAVEINNRHSSLRRSSANPFILNIYDFLHISFADYLDYLEEAVDNCDTCNCAKHVDRLICRRKKIGFSDGTLSFMLYDELKEAFSDRLHYCFEFSEDGFPNFNDCKYLIDFFVLPIALIASINKINFKGDTANE